MNKSISQTQLSNFSAFAGVVVMILGYFHVVASIDVVAFALAASWSVASVAYNYYQRYQRGDLTLGGIRK